MSKFAESLVTEIGAISASRQFNALSVRIANETQQSIRDARQDLAARIAESLKPGFIPTTAYERILDDVAHGRPRPRNFDASGL
jgi:ubiquinone biosynthesis protein UbiJ